VTTGEQFDKVSGQEGIRGVGTWLLADGRMEGSLPFGDALSADPVSAPAPAAPDDVAVLLYTSGTTGFPKGAMISHRNTLFNVDSCRATLGYREDDVGLLTLPLFHVTGLHSQLVALLACGATVLLQKEYDTGRFSSGSPGTASRRSSSSPRSTSCSRSGATSAATTSRR